MATTLKISGYLAAEAAITFSGTQQLNSLADNEYTDLSDEIDNSTNLYFEADVRVVIASAAFVTPADCGIELYLIRTVDGTNWVLIPVRPQLGGGYVRAVVGTVSGIWMAGCAGFRKVRAIVTAYTSGGSTCTLSASTALFDDFAKNGGVTSAVATAVGAAAAAVTLTLAAPGLGLRHYITYLSINRFASALLTAAAAPVTVTTTNIPTGLAFSFGAEAAPQGTLDRWREDFAFPLATTTQNTATTIVCPVTTAVIWRVTAGYYVAP